MPSGIAKDICGRGKKTGGTCQRPAGWGVPGVTTGPCRLHRGRPTIHGIYSKLDAPRLTAYLEKVQAANINLLDLKPQLELLLAMVFRFMEQEEAMEVALIAWHESYSTNIQRPLERLRSAFQATDTAELQAALTAAREALLANPTKPTRLPDIARGHVLIESFARVVEKVVKIEQDGYISLASVVRLKEAMAYVVASETTPEQSKRIEDQWGRIQLKDTK